MQDSSTNAKQQIVERIKQSANILVTVSTNPSVDALSAALALALMLNKLDKHATAVFSGMLPPAINFLEPNKTFENNVDSLRDFIIALDKEKADRLRYKVENDVVRIFITPYRTTITEKDLQFSQGDFNVDLIVALGVEKREELDKAITAHGRILHDATVVTVNAANQKSSLGSVDWQDGSTSSLCEMLMSLSETLQGNLLDQQISTALLTGIVAATERFSNQHTTPRVMTMAAQLMATGANQQLIATNLGKATQIVNAVSGQSSTEGSAKVKETPGKEKPQGEMLIKHNGEGEQSPKGPVSAPSSAPSQPPKEPNIPITPPASNAFNELKAALEKEVESQPPVEESANSAPEKATINAAQPATKERKPKQKDADNYITDKPSWMGRNIQPPSLGGTLNATAEEALETKQREEDDDRNRKILSHDQMIATPNAMPEPPVQPQPELPAQPPAPQPVVPEQMPSPPPAPEPQPAQPQAESQPLPAPEPPVQPQPAPVQLQQPPTPPAVMDSVPLQTEPTIEQLEQEARKHTAEQDQQKGDLDAARQAVNEALAAQPFNPANQPAADIGAQEFPSAPQQSGPVSPQPAPLPATAALPPLPPVPPLPDFNNLPPTPPTPQLPALPENPIEPQQGTPAPQPQAPQPPQPSDPGQFKIPSQ